MSVSFYETGCGFKILQSAAVMSIMFMGVQATITLELKPMLPTTINGSPKSPGIVDYKLKSRTEAEMTLYLPQTLSICFGICSILINTVKYGLAQLSSGGFKILQSAAVMSIMFMGVQATITLELKDHYDAIHRTRFSARGI
jgi:hypothetical protein